jgi:hypothetical protein
MNKIIKTRMYLSILIIFGLGSLVSACASPVPAVTPPPADEPASPPMTTPSASANQSARANRVEVFYFHTPQRCPTCLCFEERVVYVVKTYFQNEVDNGTLIFQVAELGDKQTAELASKYNAIGQQLFVNTVVNNNDHIVDIQDIWDWHCLADKSGFDDKIRNVIERSLEEIR